jgi:ethanolamine kinase
VITWWGMPGFYWGIWSAIQSTISEIDFDYSSYAEQRMSEYFSWKTQVGTQLARL